MLAKVGSLFLKPSSLTSSSKCRDDDRKGSTAHGQPWRETPQDVHSLQASTLCISLKLTGFAGACPDHLHDV